MTELSELVGQIQADVQKIAKDTMSEGEYKERFEKLEKDFGDVHEALKEERHRKTAQPVDDLDTKAAGTWMAQHGVKSIAHRKDKGPCHNAQRLKVYKRNMHGQVIDSLDVPECVKDAMQVMDEVHIADMLMGITAQGHQKWAREKAEKGEREAFLEHFPELGRRYDEIHKAMFDYVGKVLQTGVATGASEWVPTTFSTNLFDEIRLQMPLTNLIPHVNQPANPWVYPLLTGIGLAYRKVENASVVESTLTSANRTWTAFVNANYQSTTDELDEDSIVAIAPTIRANIIRSLGEGTDEAIMNGDNDAASHFDTDYQTGTAPFRTYQGGQNGLRQFALDPAGTGTASILDTGSPGGAITAANVGSGLALMGKFGATRLASGEVAHILNTTSWLQLLTETDSPIQTLERYGSQATILSGELGRLYGVPQFVSHGIEQRINSVDNTGVNGSTGNTYSLSVLFNRMNFRIGDRRDFRLERDRDIIVMRNDFVGSHRWSMNSIEGDVTDANWDPSGTPAVVAIVQID